MDEVTRWLEGKIAESSRSRTTDIDAAVRLAEAFLSLRGGQAGAQAFGLALPPVLPSRERLADLALATLSEWANDLRAVDDDRLSHVRHLFVAADVLEPRPPIASVGRLIVVTKALIEDSESGEEIADPQLLALVDGLTEASDFNIADFPCFDAFDFPTSGHLELRFDETARMLRGWLVFEVRRDPTEAEVDALVEVIESELFYTGWGMNLEWELPDELGGGRVVHVAATVVDRVYRPAS